MVVVIIIVSSVKDRVVYRLLRDGVCAVPRAELQRRIRAIAIKYVSKTIIIKIYIYIYLDSGCAAK